MVDKGDLMAKFQFAGVDDLLAQYEKIEANSVEMIGKAIYVGAGVVADAIRASMESIIVDNHFGTSENKIAGPNALQKKGLLEAMGITELRRDGNFWNVKVGFDGYNDLKTKRWPQGQPNTLVAQAVESGTSWMDKQPFVRRAEQLSKGRCEAVMAETFDKELKRIIGD